MESFDAEGFKTAISEYNKISPLDKWKVDLLVEIKRKLDQEMESHELKDAEEDVL